MGARNLLIPFRRDRKRDLATGEDDALLASKLRQVVLTEGATPRSSGELPWRTSFGAGLALTRHRANDATSRELARVQVRDAIRRWLPRVPLVDIAFDTTADVMSLQIRVRGDGRDVDIEIS